MTMRKGSVMLVAVVMVAALLAVVEGVPGTCNPMELSVCLPAISGANPLPPTKECCDKLKEQAPCFCGYLKIPAFKPYVDSPNAKNVQTACAFPTPTC